MADNKENNGVVNQNNADQNKNQPNTPTPPTPPNPPNPPTPPAPKEEMVTIPAATLQTILDSQKQMQSKIAELEANTQMYEQTASQDQILKIEKLRASGKLVKAVKLNYYNNKLVVAWESTVDDVHIDPMTGKEIAVQRTKITFADGEQVEIPQLDFARNKLQRQYEVVKEGRDRDGRMQYTVIMEGGQEVEVDGRFIN